MWRNKKKNHENSYQQQESRKKLLAGISNKKKVLYLLIFLAMVALLILIGKQIKNAGGYPWQDKAEPTETSQKQEEKENLKPEKRPADYQVGEEITKEVLEKTASQEFFYGMKISEDILQRIEGISYPSDCKVPIEELRYLRMLYYGFDGKCYVGEMIVNTRIEEDTLEVFQELYEIEYPIEKMVLIDDYNGSDEESMIDNNSSSFNYRVIAGTTTLSNHSIGCAIDINPLYNPYVKEKDGTLIVSPVQGMPYVDRSAKNPYAIQKGDKCCEIFEKHGFTWGGDWESCKDYQHFEK